MDVSVFNIFKQTNYKSYLEGRLSGKGQKRAFSDFVGCQPSFLSQVLNGKPDLSLEHGLMANEFLEHGKDEARHFLLLLQLSRSATKKLREHFESEIAASIEEHGKLAKRVGPEAKQLSEYTKSIYYSAWTYGAAHVMCSIDHPDQLSFLAGRLGLRRDELEKILRFLAQNGLIVQTDGRYLPSKKRVHIPEGDPLVVSHHKNSRLRALEELETRKSASLHYSMLMAIAKKDGPKIRESILGLVESLEEIVAPSKEETAFQFNLDFFEA